jgi:hypothetical protein
MLSTGLATFWFANEPLAITTAITALPRVATGFPTICETAKIAGIVTVIEQPLASVVINVRVATVIAVRDNR